MSTAVATRNLLADTSQGAEHPGPRITAALELQTLIHHSTTESSDAIGRLVQLGSTDVQLLKTLNSPFPAIADTRLKARPVVRHYNQNHGTNHQLHSTEWHLVILAVFLAGVSMQQASAAGLPPVAAELLGLIETAYTEAMGSER